MRISELLALGEVEIISATKHLTPTIVTHPFGFGDNLVLHWMDKSFSTSFNGNYSDSIAQALLLLKHHFGDVNIDL
jgi:hypothetical protein